MAGTTAHLNGIPSTHIEPRTYLARRTRIEPRGAMRIVQKSRDLAPTICDLGFRRKRQSSTSDLELPCPSTRMRVAFIAIVCAAVVAATPYPWAAPRASLVPSPKKHNRTQRGNKTRIHHHHEATPTFKQPCECAKPIVPVNLLNTNEVSRLKVRCDDS
jgi:hypothetical protein